MRCMNDEGSDFRGLLWRLALTTFNEPTNVSASHSPNSIRKCHPVIWGKYHTNITQISHKYHKNITKISRTYHSFIPFRCFLRFVVSASAWLTVEDYGLLFGLSTHTIVAIVLAMNSASQVFWSPSSLPFIHMREAPSDTHQSARGLAFVPS